MSDSDSKNAKKKFHFLVENDLKFDTCGQMHKVPYHVQKTNLKKMKYGFFALLHSDSR